MHSLQKLFLDRLTNGLSRKAIHKPSEWAETYRVMNTGKWKFDRHPWTRAMHDSEAEINVGQKGAQLGFTEAALNITFYKIDIEGVDCLYVLPNLTPDASNFSASRFDPALESSDHLSKMFSDVKNVGHKRAGSANLYIRGSKSRSALKSIPVGFLVLDEVDEMEQDNIPLAYERTAGQRKRQIWEISTPTIPGEGINKKYEMSTKEHFMFICPHCGRRTELIFPDCLVITAEDCTDPDIYGSHYICKECKNKLENEAKIEFLNTGIWVPEHEGMAIRGFHVNQMYSMAKAGEPFNIAMGYLRALTNPADDQEFHNSKLGITRLVEGAQVNDSEIEACKRNYRNNELKGGLVTMGVDVGTWMHYEVDQWTFSGDAQASSDINSMAKPRCIEFGKVKTFEELDGIMARHGIMSCVIDANPERRKSHEFASRFPGLVNCCFYGRGITGKQINKTKDQSERMIVVDRTTWLDLSMGRFRNGNIDLPVDLSLEYRNHIKSIVRRYEKDKETGAVTAKWINIADDHFAHARVYSEIAFVFATSMGASQNMGKLL